jgi:hypothetical protein
MNIAPQHPAVFRSTFPGYAATVRASDCPDADLTVIFPDGSTIVVPDKVACCYSFPSCKHCSSNKRYEKWANSYFPACSGPGGCYVSQGSCSL